MSFGKFSGQTSVDETEQVDGNPDKNEDGPLKKAGSEIVETPIDKQKIPEFAAKPGPETEHTRLGPEIPEGIPSAEAGPGTELTPRTFIFFLLIG